MSSCPHHTFIGVLFALIMFSFEILPIDSSTTLQTHTLKNAMRPNPQDQQLEFLEDLRKKYVHQPVFLQSVQEIALSLTPLFNDPDKGEFYKRAFVAMAEPERIISFRVPWEDDNGNIVFNRGWRVEFSRYV